MEFVNNSADEPQQFTFSEIFDKQRIACDAVMKSPQNIVFLDIDGVLNTVSTKERSPMGYVGIQKDKVRILSTILSENNAALVLTSTWKRTWSLSFPEMSMDLDARYMVSRFADANIFICSKTVDDGDDRGHGIKNWLDAHPHKGWIVLDDEIFVDYRDCGIFPHLIRTSCYPGEGLKEKHIQTAARLFAKQASGGNQAAEMSASYERMDKLPETHHFGKS